MTHHPSLEMLINYAAGKLPPAFILAVETHIELCPICKRTVNQLQAVHGALLEEIRPVATSSTLLQSIFSDIDQAMDPRQPARKEMLSQPDFIPRVLSRFLESTFDHLNWRRVSDYFDEAIISVFEPPYRFSLLRAKGGEYVPMHNHLGQECLVVLSGGFRANGSRFERGDFAHCNAGVVHEPVVDTHDHCICLLVLDAPLDFAKGKKNELNKNFQMTTRASTS